MFKHPLLYVWIVLIGAFVGAGLLRPTAPLPSEVNIGPEPKQQPPYSKQQGTKKTPPPNATLGQPKDKEDAAGHQGAAAQEKKGEDADGAKWTDVWIARLTVVLAFVAAAQLIAAGLQAKWTRDAVRAAKDSATAAEHALTKLQRAFVAQTRFNTRAAVTADKQQILRISCVLENSGSTPTRHCTFQLNFGVFPEPLTDTFGFFDVEGGEPSRSVIGPKAKAETEALNVLMSEIESANKGMVAIYFWGWAEYDDVFDGTSRHRTEFCYRLVGYRGALSQGDLSFESHRAHNGMDDECPPQRYRTSKGGIWKEPRQPTLPRNRVA